MIWVEKIWGLYNILYYDLKLFQKLLLIYKHILNSEQFCLIISSIFTRSNFTYILEFSKLLSFANKLATITTRLYFDLETSIYSKNSDRYSIIY